MSQEDEQRAYLASVMERTGWNQTELAQRAGLDPSTLSRFINGGREGHALRPGTIRKIEQASGLAVSGEAVAVAAQGFAESEASPFEVLAHSPFKAIIAALAQGRMNLDPWTLQSRALEGAGYRPGDILLVALDETPALGDVVCAQIYDWTKGRAETVFRIFQPPYLIAATGDPQLMRPHLVDDGAVTIKGVVLQSLRGRGAT
ncbi:MAG: helix-turn-helix transcriptional regulator [Rhizobiales bacterium]|nr:helix-turn-helix transcriptional regulator [Hyphomicrobiales bacterium]